MKQLQIFIILALSISIATCIDCSFRSSYPRQYIAYKLDKNITLDGKLDEEFWQETPFTQDFEDISTNVTPRFRTQAKMRWNDEFLYVGAILEEPQIWANLTGDETVIFNDNDFEIFVNADATNHYYKEYEMNARNHTWNLCLNKPYLNGGYENSARVFDRTGFTMQPPLKAATYIEGKLNDPTANNKFWSVEVALPIEKLLYNQTGADNLRPSDKKFWRINFSRVEWKVVVVNGTYQKVLNTSEDNWVWQKIGIIDIHLPELWGILQFTNKTSPKSQPQDLIYYDQWPIRQLAMQLYNAQLQYFTKNNKYTQDLNELESLLEENYVKECLKIQPTIELVDNGYQITVVLGKYMATITDDRYLQVNHRFVKNI